MTMRIKLFAICVTLILAAAVYTAKRSEGKVDVAGNGERGIVVTLSEPDRSVLAVGDELRKAHRYDEAIASYNDLLKRDDIDRAVKAEAKYNIGLSYTWLGDYDRAEKVFQKMLGKYSDNMNAVGYAQYCLAYIEVQKGKYNEAIARLRRSLDSKTITDRELAARTQFMIGSTYLLFLHDNNRAKNAFALVLAQYPDAVIANHPYLDHLKNR